MNIVLREIQVSLVVGQINCLGNFLLYAMCISCSIPQVGSGRSDVHTNLIPTLIKQSK